MLERKCLAAFKAARPKFFVLAIPILIGLNQGLKD